jgi:predicted solute-binding protein
LNWRIGGLSYLNTRPLVYGIEDIVTPGEPARMADLMRRGQFDAAIVPIAEVLAHDEYDVLDGIAIASRGPVWSVFVAHRKPIQELRRVALDPASRTSAWLVRVILKFAYGVDPEFATGAGDEASLLIGDQAIWYRTKNPDVPVLDLGEAWWKLTGLPFVYAVWAMPRGAVPGSLGELVRQAKADGLAHLEEIVQDATEGTAEFRRQYLTRCVCYDLGDAEKQGIRRFQQYLKELGLIKECHDLRYVS